MFLVSGLGAFYPIKGILTKEKYRQILIHQMRPSARQPHGDDFVFHHDNDPKHTSHLVKYYLHNEQSAIWIQLRTCGHGFIIKLNDDVAIATSEEELFLQI